VQGNAVVVDSSVVAVGVDEVVDVVGGGGGCVVVVNGGSVGSEKVGSCVSSLLTCLLHAYRYHAWVVYCL